jgi:hypothetical protein
MTGVTPNMLGAPLFFAGILPLKTEPKNPKNPLDRIGSPATIRAVVYASFIKTQQPNPYPSGVNDEKGVPTDDQVKPPKGLRFFFGGTCRVRPF